MDKLKPLQQTETVAEEKQTQTANQPIAKNENQVQITGSLLQKINGELCFNLQFGEKTLLISESKCSQLIPEFKKMNADQKETFLMQAAIFGANPFTVPAEIYPLPFVSGGVTTYAPAISAKKYIEKGMENPLFGGMKSGVIVEKADGTFDYRRGQFYSAKTEKLVGGWAEIFIKGVREPIFRGVNIDEFIQRKSDGTPNKFWKDKPALMIEKVAQKQAMEISMKMPRTYIAEEMPTIEEAEHEDLTEQKQLTNGNEQFFGSDNNE